MVTDSGSEGLNLQFCNTIINYDLPWNPQKIEQRIGRCHRYGQKNDVVVFNLLNTQNVADKRVYEILSNKFELFKGVFGASDRAIGLLESGADFEKRVSHIYQECKTSKDFTKEFTSLERELDRKRNKKMEQLKSLIIREAPEQHKETFEKILSDIQAYQEQLDYWEKAELSHKQVIYPLFYELKNGLNIPGIEHGYLLIGGYYAGEELIQSVFQISDEKGKIYAASIANLRLLTALYGDWIKNELKENPQMQESSFQATGKSIIEKCLDSLRRMNEGIDLIEKDGNAFKAFTFMNQSMYLQRSITAYSKDCGRGIPCSLSDYMKDNKEKGIEQDHSEWRPFQIAFILLNIKGLIDPESDERNIVDLLYFPTGGGKTEQFPNCTDAEINDILSLCFEMYNMKHSDSIELVITAPETFRIKTKKTRDVVENLIKNAEKSVVMTGYSISDYFTGMLDTIIAKSQQGVYVRFYVNDIEKSRASLVKMLAYRGKYLQFFEYEKNSDDKMAASHAKILTIDSDKSLVSSANLSYHGLSGNIEMGFLVRSADKAKQIEELLKELVRMFSS